MVRAYKIKLETYATKGRDIINKSIRKGSVAAKLGTLSLSYISVDGKPYYNMQDFFEYFKRSKDGMYEGNMRNLNTIATSHIRGNQGTGTVFCLKRGLYGDTSFMAFACETLRLVDCEELKDQNSLLALIPVDMNDYKSLVRIARREMPDAPVDESYPSFKISDFYRVIPSTLKGSGGNQDASAINIPWSSESESEPKQEEGQVLSRVENGYIVPPEKESQEPVVDVNCEDNHPIQKDIIKAETTSERLKRIKRKLAQDLADSLVEETENTPPITTTTAKTSVLGLIEALLKGKKLNINITVAID